MQLQRFHLIRSLACLGLAGLLTACGAIFDKEEEASRPCPVAVAIGDASRLTRFNGTGHDLTDVSFDAILEDVQYSCRYSDNAVSMSVTVVIGTAQGPGNTTDEARFDYFVAVASSDRVVLAREDFDVTMPFEGSLTRVQFTETVQPRIPLKPGETGANYRVFIGFALTEEELAYNRRQQ